MTRLLLLQFTLTATGLWAADNALPRMVLWRQPKPSTPRDWICGPRGCDAAPVAPFRFKSDEERGSAPKLAVVDARGRSWSVKLGPEVIPECFGSRFLTAIGYIAEPTYFVKEGKLEGLPELHGESGRLVDKDGTFRNARFQARGLKDFEFIKDQAWSWNDNPFLGTHELAGLKIVMMLLSNWDAKDARDGGESNNGVFRNDKGEWLYSMYDWGASLGHWGGVFRRDQSDCVGYRGDTPEFIQGIEGNIVEFGYRGKHADDIRKGISVDDVRWLLRYLSALQPEHLRAGLKASGASDRQTVCWAAAIQDRVRALQSATH